MKDTPILLVEDDKALALLMRQELVRGGCRVECAASGEEAIARLGKGLFEVVVTDLVLPGADGLRVLQESKRLQPESEVLLVTGQASIATAVAAMRAGAYDYLVKPVEPGELTLAVQKAVEHRGLLSEVKRLRDLARAKYSFDGIVYAGSSMDAVLELVKKVAATDATVLVSGESGTGKELIARAIHENSPRRAGAFVAINCGAIPEGLLESELFGHVRGAFTGAERHRRGLFEEAGGGTLFLDEISETTPGLQVKLLRAIESGEIRRVGETHPVKISVRLIAATNRDLAKASREGKFREDLYYRLNVFPIDLPSLRDRPEDIIPLAEHFLRKARAKLGVPAAALDPETGGALRAYAWPGNVRELEHAIERALIMAAGPLIRPRDLPPELQAAGVSAGTETPQALAEVERRHILWVLQACGNNQLAAARRLGIGRNTLRRKLAAFGVAARRVRRPGS